MRCFAINSPLRNIYSPKGVSGAAQSGYYIPAYRKVTRCSRSDCNSRYSQHKDLLNGFSATNRIKIILRIVFMLLFIPIMTLWGANALSLRRCMYKCAIENIYDFILQGRATPGGILFPKFQSRNTRPKLWSSTCQCHGPSNHAEPSRSSMTLCCVHVFTKTGFKTISTLFDAVDLRQCWPKTVLEILYILKNLDFRRDAKRIIVFSFWLCTCTFILNLRKFLILFFGQVSHVGITRDPSTIPLTSVDF